MFQLPMDQVLKYQLFEDIDEVLRDLPPRDERVLRLRFGIGVDSEHTLEEIGEQFGISRERIRQIEQTALRKIKISKKSEILKLILDK
jgi:RNA polymerase primary sigma factor